MHSYIWYELPIPDSAIQTIHRIAKKEKQLAIFDGKLQFEWSDRTIIQDLDNDD